jgi:hypothetical protein
VSLYGTNTQATSVAPGDGVTLMNGTETGLSAAVPVATERIVIAPVGHRSGVRLRFRGTFSAAPGAFEVDIQEADADSAINYTNVPGASATAVDSNQQFYINVIDSAEGPFFRANIKTLANNVKLTLVVVDA